jgi:hypothetical protein
MSPVHIDELNPETRAKVLQQIGETQRTTALATVEKEAFTTFGDPAADTVPAELLEQVPEVEARIIEEMTTKVFVPVREITEKSRGAIKKVIEENAALFTEARTIFSAQGRRVPVEGKPTWNEWLKQNLPCSDRYVRKILADIGEEPQDRAKPESDESPLNEAFEALSPFFGEGAGCPLNVLPTALDWVKQNQPLTPEQVETLSAVVNVLGQISKFTSQYRAELEALLKHEEVAA